jgi:hypothetical protein
MRARGRVAPWFPAMVKGRASARSAFVEDQLTVTFLIKKLLTKCVCTSHWTVSFWQHPPANQLRNYHSTTPHT